MTWLIGRRIKEVKKKDSSWIFALDDGSTITTESHWRLITAKGIVVVSEDDGHPFGLSAPVDAAGRLKDTVGQNTITRFELKELTSDLVLHFPNGSAIEFLNFSCGYEGWRTVHRGQEVICLGGGELHEFGRSEE
jgi:hypothetical protein